MLKNLRIRKFEPEEEYVYFTYSIKNSEREKSKELIKEYRTLLQKAIDYLWSLTKIQVRKKNGNYKITLPKKREVYKPLRDELEKINHLASHYVDKAINNAFSIITSWRKRAIKGRASIEKPTLKKAYVKVKSTLRKVVGESVRITVRPHEYITFSWSKSWFSRRVRELELGEPIIKEEKVYLPFRYKLPWATPVNFLAIDSNLYTLDAYDGEKFVTISLKQLYSLKYSMEVKRAKVQSFASKHTKRGRELLRKYSHRERNRVLDFVHKFVNTLLDLYPVTFFAVEKLDKESMFKDANDSLSRKISRTVWGSIHKVLEYKAPLYGSFVKEVNPYLTSRSCPRCGFVSRKVGKTFECERCGFKLDRQLNASLNIYLKMCGFPHIRDVPRVWVGVIPLMGRRGMNVRDFGEAQGLRIDIKYHEIL
ncbi:transposase [Saccharolobus solfataricus]|uniref:Second ORF in transposon ISC1904 n=3 Tax=Saccharolobus solfataricus TaxID=2287 RepID=Q97XQ0_SACS2|nr:RNA-guided endonuclease TnpB family protein [Saccharolobus solfataricus]AAK41873.1 Second ORF in transposon ISC1904 [Saccharolobus solfataricus P2]AKA74606.1 transposase [Saccharolobus solfataricus]AKA77302.1 transposase [Saccharolobus solfataricus]AKA79993.1 transposase [Saccharolobus solfataricus]AZF69074.1 transposase [Saccharolobus solfataricus]